MNGDGAVRVRASRSGEGDGAGLGLDLCRGQFCLDVNSTTEDELLDLHLGGDAIDNERCPRRVDG